MNTAAVRDFGRRAWHRARRRLGWPGLAGVAMLVLALAVLAALRAAPAAATPFAERGRVHQVPWIW